MLAALLLSLAAAAASQPPAGPGAVEVGTPVFVSSFEGRCMYFATDAGVERDELRAWFRGNYGLDRRIDVVADAAAPPRCTAEAVSILREAGFHDVRESHRAASDYPSIGPPMAGPPTAAVVPLDNLPALKGGYFRIESKAVGRGFHIYVRLPEGYDAAAGKTYPIVYLLDGDSAFPMLAPEHLFLHYDEGLEEAIVVGIAYGSFDPAVNRRDVDYLDEALPAERPGAAAGTAGAAPAKGGAAAFQAFLKSELLPEVERRYRGDPARRVLVGQSFGGTFVLYSAFTDPDLFWGRIASNPSFRAGRTRFFAAPAAGRRRDLGLVVVSGERNNPAGRQGALDWFAAWTGRKDAPWAVKRVDIPGGTHSADFANAYRAGMLWLLRDRGKAADAPAGTAPH